MKALQIVKPREFRIVDLEKPRPRDDEVIVRLEYAAICNQNDYKIFYGLYGVQAVGEEPFHLQIRAAC